MPSSPAPATLPLLSRRSMLRATGAGIGLPLLDAMLPTSHHETVHRDGGFSGHPPVAVDKTLTRPGSRFAT